MTVDNTRHAGGLGGALDLHGEVEQHLDTAGDVLHRHHGGREANLGADLDGTGEADLLQTVVDAHRDALDVEQLGEERDDQGQGQVAVRDRAAERAVLRPYGIDVDPLVVVGGVGDGVHPFRGDLQPRAPAEVLPGERLA